MRNTHIALNTSYTNSQVEDQQHITCVEFIDNVREELGRRILK